MLRYKYNDVDAVTIPDEINLVLSITGCSLACKNCHSEDTWNPSEGKLLTKSEIDNLIQINKHITCVVFFGGEWNPLFLYQAIKRIKKYNLKVGLYTGKNYKDSIPNNILDNLDYLKLGEYKEKYGGLESPKTNQRLYQIIDGDYIDITKKYWRK